MQEELSSPLQVAQHALAAEIRRRRLHGVDLRLEENDWLTIYLKHEDRAVWLGFRESEGYFLSWTRSELEGPYFSLDEDSISSILSLAPARSGLSADSREGNVRQFLDSLSGADPDTDKIEELLDEADASSEGLDVLATIASLKRFRLAIDELRGMVATDEEDRYKEEDYRVLFSSNPWMLGGHFVELLAEEFPMWEDSRLDLFLGNALGYAEVIELKRPSMKLLFRGKSVNTWRYSKDLSDALAQARKYIKNIDEHRPEIMRRLRLKKQSVSRMYRSGVIVVAGRTPVDAGALDAMRDANIENARIELLTYDDVIAISESMIKIFERRLLRNPPLLG